MNVTEVDCFATVCDGVTQSMHSRDAADVVCRDPAELWSSGAMNRRVELLRERRRELIASGSSEPVDETSFLGRAFAEILRDKRQYALQTTMVAVRISPLVGDRVLVEAMTCGDSALLVFDRCGRLLLSNLEVDTSSPFGHVSSTTEVLPDHFDEERSKLAVKLDYTPHVILCTDGFYDAFGNPAALFRWLLLNSGSLCQASPAEVAASSVFNALHARLDAHRGDDDISVVWLCPRVTDPPSPEVDVPRPVTNVMTWWQRLAALAASLRPAFQRLARFTRKLRGGRHAEGRD